MSDVLPGFTPPPPPKDAPRDERLPQRERDRLAIESGIKRWPACIAFQPKDGDTDD